MLDVFLGRIFVKPFGRRSEISDLSSTSPVLKKSASEEHLATSTTSKCGWIILSSFSSRMRHSELTSQAGLIVVHLSYCAVVYPLCCFVALLVVYA